ncbi:hypothetical protein Ahy_A07g037331 isoform B [Arachis hypogaea]|uniref:PRONE domain-containing protein n=1 Tax=Arachis hypogaea TaxID=3818 RepID=A0A445CIF6_ARAHY|nr:hypothetical protein Ahy_A07g037331 isoform B [Arachis hypogaea]
MTWTGNGEVGDVVGEDVGGVGDADASLLAFGEVNLVQSNTVSADNLELGEGVDHGGVSTQFGVADECANGIGVCFGEGGEGGVVPEPEEVEAFCQLLFQDWSGKWFCEEVSFQVCKDKIRHGSASFDGGASNMRQEHNIVQLKQLWRHMSGERVAALVLPFSASDEDIALTQPPQEGDNQGHCHVSGLVGDDIRGVSHADPSLGALSEIDLVNADAIAGHDLQHWKRIDELGVGAVHGIHDDGAYGSSVFGSVTEEVESGLEVVLEVREGRHAKSLSVDTGGSKESPADTDGAASSRSQGSKPLNESEKIANKPKVLTPEETALKESIDELLKDMEQMKERFSKLLLGEDMSGGGKGVSSALALSNAFTNLAASIFGEQRRLEPMPPERKAKWRKEIDWLLSVTDYVVEMVPSQQVGKDGTIMEIMTTKQRTDLHMNVPALRKLDTMLIDCLDNFKEPQEFFYVKKDSGGDDKDPKMKSDEKWWLPTPKVPPEGLSDNARRFLQYQKDCVNQVLKAAMAINAQVITEMEVPENYMDSLPKNGRSSLGDSIYKSITVEHFDPDQLLSTMDLSSEHKILDLKNRIEASIVIWKRKMHHKDGKPSWSSAVSLEKRELFEERAETILLLLKHRFPGLPQSSLEISKIQFNRDVGLAVLESYSRILESLAFTVLSRIDDVLQADFQTQIPAKKSGNRTSSRPSPREKGNGGDNGQMTLLDFMGWGTDQGSEGKKEKDPFAASDDFYKDIDSKHEQKLPNVNTHKKTSYLDNLNIMRSPTSRH